MLLFFLITKRNLAPSKISLQYDYMERLDGKEKWSVVESPRERRSIQTVVLNEAVFVQYLDAGAWHLAFYNDGRERESVSFSTNVMGEKESTFYRCGQSIGLWRRNLSLLFWASRNVTNSHNLRDGFKTSDTGMPE